MKDKLVKVTLRLKQSQNQKIKELSAELKEKRKKLKKNKEKIKDWSESAVVRTELDKTLWKKKI